MKTLLKNGRSGQNCPICTYYVSRGDLIPIRIWQIVHTFSKINILLIRFQQSILNYFHKNGFEWIIFTLQTKRNNNFVIRNKDWYIQDWLLICYEQDNILWILNLFDIYLALLSRIKVDSWIFLFPRNLEILGLDLANLSLTSISKTSEENPTKVNCCKARFLC